MVFRRSNVWGTNSEIPYWWRVLTKILFKRFLFSERNASLAFNFNTILCGESSYASIVRTAYRSGGGGGGEWRGDRGGSRGRVQGVRPPSPEMTCGFLIQLVFCKKKNYVVYWCWSRARDECNPSWKKSWIRPWEMKDREELSQSSNWNKKGWLEVGNFHEIGLCSLKNLDSCCFHLSRKKERTSKY